MNFLKTKVAVNAPNIISCSAKIHFK